MKHVQNHQNVASSRLRTPANIRVRCVCGRRGEGKKNGRQVCGLLPKVLSDDCLKHSAVACFLKADGAIICVPLPLKRRRLGGLPYGRIIAASRICRGFFIFGLGSYVVHSLTGAPRRKPSGLLIPMCQSANLRGVAHPLGGGVIGFENRNHIGVSTMSATHHQGDSSPEEVLTAETVQAFLSHTLSADLSNDMAARLRAASDTAFGILYRVTEGSYHARPWAPQLTDNQRADLEAFMRGVLRVVSLESINRDWRLRSGAGYNEEEADDE